MDLGACVQGGSAASPRVARGPSQFDSKEAKEAHVQGMFDALAPRYDLLNRVIAGNMDQRWRRKAARAAVTRGEGPFLDVGAGTGDLTFAIGRAAPRARVFGLDLARNMLALGRTKKGHDAARMGFVHGSALALPAREGTFEGITNAFVLRNLADLDAFFREAHRALRPGGRLVSLEISRPRGRAFGPVYRLYFFRIMPRIGRALSGDPKAYDYLADSVARIAEPEVLADKMRAAGFARVEAKPLMRGAVVLFLAEKAPNPAP